jgi:hypothetical protein
MTAGGELPLRVLVVVGMIGLYYWFVKRWLYARCTWLAERVSFSRRYALHEVASVFELIVGAGSHVLFCVALIVVTGVPVAGLGLGPPPPILLGYGVLLGIGTMMIGTLASRTLVQTVMIVQPTGGPAGLGEWFTMSRGGWMRHYLRVLEVCPPPVAALLLVVQVGCEELVFRGILIGYFRPYGMAWAVALSTCFFVAMQASLMPSWRNAIFPMTGAAVIGVVNGVLFWLVPFLWPLLVAHIAFFVFAVI